MGNAGEIKVWILFSSSRSERVVSATTTCRLATAQQPFLPIDQPPQTRPDVSTIFLSQYLRIRGRRPVVSPISVEATRRRRHVVPATPHHLLVPTPIALPVQVRVTPPIHQHGATPVPLRVHPLVPPVEILVAEVLVGVAAPVLARREIVESGGTLRDVRGARRLVALLPLVAAPVEAAGGGLVPARRLRAPDGRLAGGDGVLHSGGGRLFTDPLEVVVAAGRAVPQAAGLVGGCGGDVGGGAMGGGGRPGDGYLQGGVIFGAGVFFF